MNDLTFLAGLAMQGLLSQHQTVECESGNRDLEPIYDGRNNALLATRTLAVAKAIAAEIAKEKK